MKNLIWIITYLFIVCHLSGLICEVVSDQVSSSNTPLASPSSSYASIVLDHPDKSGYQSHQLGSEKHKYGYELKSSGKHFHHTSTEKDGVRLGCFGYELEGKKYITQYVADARGYRLVTNQDLISVYPKGGTEGKAGFFPDFNDDDQPRNVRYFFPKGCKGIDVQIDNSSRLRSLKIENNARLPVTMKPANPQSDSYYTRPPQSYPGPSNIYAPSLVPIQTARPPTSYLPPHQLPDNIFIPPLNNTYLPPYKPNNISNLLENSIDNTYVPPELPANYFVLPEEELNSSPTPSISSSNNAAYQGTSGSSNNNINELLPPKEPNCPGTIQYCDSTNGCLIIPIELKNRNSENCCSNSNYAKLILPLKNFNEDTVQKIINIVPKELDANDLIQNILDNLL
ncbi:hypothetical protein PVAND_011809 [Polypedilum vanderplanki]|uniref:Uncharacterized protein n=1 Tax=Polypedilum vanderplanki TaxID=319348 RepID=A0A9J6CJR6_POLVA|nr:hypothetical protein PVAND_011809 [Polypedilum vanderplanki]